MDILHSKRMRRRRPADSLHERSRRAIFGLIAGQLGAAVVIAAVLTLAAGTGAGYSALVGGLIGVIPNYHFASRLARRRRSAVAAESLRHIYTGEFIKIAFTAALFVIAIRLLSVDFLVVISTYLATVVVNWLAVLLSDLGELPRGAPAGAERAQMQGER